VSLDRASLSWDLFRLPPKPSVEFGSVRFSPGLLKSQKILSFVFQSAESAVQLVLITVECPLLFPFQSPSVVQIHVGFHLCGLCGVAAIPFLPFHRRCLKLIDPKIRFKVASFITESET